MKNTEFSNIKNMNEVVTYIAPANPAGRQLMDKLSSQGAKVVGLVDNIKVGEGIFHPYQLGSSSEVIVANGSFQSVVAEQLIKNGLNIKQVKTLSEKGDVSHYSRSAMVRFRSVMTDVLISFIKLLRRIPYRHRRVYYAESFVDANVLVTYTKNIEDNKKSKRDYPVLVVDKLSSAPNELNAISFEQQPLIAFFHLLFARSFVVDHEYQSLIFSALRSSVPVIQLWHGLPYKHLSGNSHYPNINDACFISSSNWFNKEIFSKIFNSKRFLGVGYPRNDVFFQTREQRCWINSEPLSVLENTISRTGQIIIYAPTYRDSQDNNYPLNLAEINDWCIQHNCSFILKYHPFIYRTVTENMGISATDQLLVLPEFSHIYIFPNGKNVYPWLAEATMLITDYSSIAFDFMLSGKPILYYQFDKQNYETIRGKPLVGDDVFIKGEVVAHFDELLPLMTESIQAIDKRTVSCQKMPINDQLEVCTEQILVILDEIEERE